MGGSLSAKFLGVAGAIKVERGRLFPCVHRCHRPGCGEGVLWSKGAQTRTTGGVGIGRGGELAFSKVRGEGVRPPAAPSGCRVVCLACAWCGWCAWWFAWASAALLPLILSRVLGVWCRACQGGTTVPTGVSRVFKACVVRVWRSLFFFPLCHRSLFPAFSLSPFPFPTVHTTFTNINSTRYPARVRVRVFRVQHSSIFLPSVGHSYAWFFFLFF